MSTLWSNEALAELAELELLQGFEVLDGTRSERRRALYDLFGSAEVPWATKAHTAYTAMAREGGYVASVADQLSAELDIFENTDVYAAIGGLDAAEITTGLGSWWSPSATWFLYGRVLSASDPERPFFDDRTAIRQLLLRLGAFSLARFYEHVADGALRLTKSKRWLPGRRARRREVAFVAGVLTLRRTLLLEGPGKDGRYFSTESVSPEEIIEAARSSKSTERRTGRVPVP